MKLNENKNKMLTRVLYVVSLILAAGIAVKAGARSALATLWSVSDQASADLIKTFYNKLIDTGVSRAAALRQAQLTLAQDVRYEHPFYWSPFILINNWL